MATDAYDRVTFRGVTLNKRTRAMIWEAERRLGYRFDVLQGSYHPGVGASAGTHDLGGAVDLWPTTGDVTKAVHVLRRVGFAAWERTPAQGFGFHIHAIAIGDRELAPLAAGQVTSYYNGCNGLGALNEPDGDPYRPDPIPVFNYPKWQKANRVRAAINALLEKLRKKRRRLAQLAAH